MPEFKVIWTQRSLSDLQNIYDFAYKASPKHAKKLLGQITSRERQLGTFPRSGRLEISLNSIEGEFRFIVEGHHKIIYKFNGADVIVVRVFDTRQDP